MKERTRIAVVGVGNEYRHDDGLGPAVVARIRKRTTVRPLPPGTTLDTSDGEPGRLITLWEGADLAVILDAAHAHPGTPGRVHRIELDAGRLARPAAGSSHGLGLGEAVELARVLGRLPGRLVVFAVEGTDHSLGPGLSPAVAAAVGPLAESVEREIVRHRDAAARGEP
ncbi:hydrogenase maturation protease [Streptomyces sp. AN091965]|uniref:hydrogenase maturation protease n=1 Tax=Streptomyces sp. AN091965 TaxID=2927803 RepID=UPI001F61518E|nr:hydrogenase maturation protease [Streptomyces sp. AN091965]MCI3928857.1 hydrogenase maturation protease [Streptomyces sp. AN091965]